MVVKSPLTPITTEMFADDAQALRWMGRLHNWSCKKTKDGDGDCWEIVLRHGGCRITAYSYSGFLPGVQAAANKLTQKIKQKHGANLRIAR